MEGEEGERREREEGGKEGPKRIQTRGKQGVDNPTLVTLPHPTNRFRCLPRLLESHARTASGQERPCPPAHTCAL
eukprot:274986-Hanusia_phi.AAC.1